MEIWLKQEKEEIRFPVNPPNFEITSPQNNQTVAINAIGEINMLGKRGLITLSLSSFFPHPKNKYNDSIVEYSNYQKPYEYIKILKNWKEKGICKLILTGVINMYCTIENLTYSEEDGTGDVYYTIELKEHPMIKTKKKEEKTRINEKQTEIKPTETARKAKEIKTQTYVVKKGDTLMQIAKKITGDAKNYIVIAKQNNIKNPNLIYPNQKLVIQI